MNIDDYNELPLGDKAFWWLEELWRKRSKERPETRAVCPFYVCKLDMKSFPPLNFVIHLNDEHQIPFIEIAEMIENADKDNNVNLIIGGLDGRS